MEEEEEERIVRNVRNPVSRDHKKEEDKGKRKKMGEEEEEEEAVCCRLDLLQRHRQKKVKIPLSRETKGR